MASAHKPGFTAHPETGREEQGWGLAYSSWLGL